MALLTAHEAHTFWPGDQGDAAVRAGSIVGHRQVADAYLAALAEERGSRVVTLDGGLAAFRPSSVELLAID